MRSDDYQRLRQAFIEMARQRPDSPEVARWLAIAQSCLDLERQSSPSVKAHSRRTAGHLRPQRPAVQQDKTVGRTELPHRDQNVPNNMPGSIYLKVGA
jgi:hypothetical protein